MRKVLDDANVRGSLSCSFRSCREDFLNDLMAGITGDPMVLRMHPAYNSRGGGASLVVPAREMFGSAMPGSMRLIAVALEAMDSVNYFEVISCLRKIRIADPTRTITQASRIAREIQTLGEALKVGTGRKALPLSNHERKLSRL